MRPDPPQCEHNSDEFSTTEGLSRCLDNSRSPKPLIWPICIRALSFLIASFNFFSTLFLFLISSMSMKSITTRPERSLSLACLANSSAASKFVLSAVSSIDLSLVALPELTSIATNASV